MKGTFVIAVLTAVVLNGIPSHGTLFVSAWSTPNASVLPNATLFLSPTKVTGLKDQTVSVSVNIADVVNLFSFQIGIRFDPDMVECLNVTEGGFLSNNGADFMLSLPGTINNTEGSVIPYGWSLLDTTEAKSGSGVLAKFVFHMKITGYSNLHIRSFIAIDKTGANEIPVNTIDVYTPLRKWIENSISIVGNAQGQSIKEDSGYSAHNISNAFPLLEYHFFQFNVTGFSINNSTFAFCNVSIPKNLLWANYQGPPNGGWWLLLNGNTHTIKTIYENATHTSLYFEFNYDASNPTTVVKIGTVIDLEHPYPNAVLSVLMNKWWYSSGEHVTVRAKFTIDNVPVPAATVLLKVTYPNMSLCLSFYNITEPNGNATLNFLINPNMPFGNYSIQLLAGKLGVPGAYAIKFFWVWRPPLITPYPWQLANYRYHRNAQNGTQLEHGWWNMTYTRYAEPNLMNASHRFFTVSAGGNLSQNYWTSINTTTRWTTEGNASFVHTYYMFWIQANVSMGSQFAILNGTGQVIGSTIFLLRMTDGTIGFVDCWIAQYAESRSLVHTFFFDKKTGLLVYYEKFLLFTYTYFELAATNIPIGYDWGDINSDGTVNSTDVAFMQIVWQAKTGDVDYEPNMDFNGDGIINIKDATLIGFNWHRRHEVLP